MKKIKQMFRRILYDRAFKLVTKRIRTRREPYEDLMPRHLRDSGWREIEYNTFVEKSIKPRDMVTIKFEEDPSTRIISYYRVYHSERKTFIALAASRKWFDTYMMLLKHDQAEI